MIMAHKSRIYDTESETDHLLQDHKKDTFSNIKCSISLKWKIWINLIVISLSYAITMTSYNVISTAQTSLNYKDGLGSTSIALTSIGAVFGSLFFNSVHKKCGSKISVALGFFSYIVYMLTNLYPKWYTMIPAGLLAGVFGCFMQISFKTLIAQIAQQYCEIQNQQDHVDKVQTRMFMVNILLYKGSLAAFLPVTSIILGINKQSAEANKNESMNMESDTMSHCGSAYCNEGFSQAINSTLIDNNAVDFASVLKLVVFCVAFVLLALFVLIFVKIPKSISDCHRKAKTFPVAIMAKPQMLLLTPTFMIVMGADAFWNLDFVSAFITCPMGIGYIGLVMTWTGVSGAISCLVFGSFNTEKFRKVPLVFSALIQMAILAFLLVWPMKGNVFFILCILTSGWYIASGIRLTLLSALNAVVFPDDLQSSFSVMHLWMFLGAFAMTLWSGLLCTSTKIIITLIIIGISLFCYICLEINIAKEKRRQLDTITETGSVWFKLFRLIRDAFL